MTNDNNRSNSQIKEADERANRQRMEADRADKRSADDDTKAAEWHTDAAEQKQTAMKSK